MIWHFEVFIHGIAVCCIWKHLGEVSADAYALSDGTQAPDYSCPCVKMTLLIAGAHAKISSEQWEWHEYENTMFPRTLSERLDYTNGKKKSFKK